MDTSLLWFALIALAQLVVSQPDNVMKETEMFSIPISPNLFNWTYQEFDQQYRFHASLLGRPELPSWLRYIYSGRHHAGFIFGTPPRGVKSPIEIEVIALNRQDYETRRIQMNLTIAPKEKMALHEVEMKIDNLNVEDLLDIHRMQHLKDIFRLTLWPESEGDLYATFLSSAVELGARLPLKPNEGEGLVVRLGSFSPFSKEILRLRAEVRPLSRLGSCPRDYKRTTVERRFRDADFTLDWCSFKLYDITYHKTSTELIENDEGSTKKVKKIEKFRNIESKTWESTSKDELPSRSYVEDFVWSAVIPTFVMGVMLTVFTAAFFFTGVSDQETEYFLNNIFHICIDYNNKRAPKEVEIIRYGTGNTEQTQVDNNSTKSLAVSPNNSLARLHSPKSNTNLAGSYNRPQPPPYIGSNTNSLHHRKSEKATPDEHHRPGHLALEESLKLLNEANIASVDYIERNNLRNDLVALKDPIIDLNDTAEDYVLIKPVLKPDFDSNLNGYTDYSPESVDLKSRQDEFILKQDFLGMKDGLSGNGVGI